MSDINEEVEDAKVKLNTQDVGTPAKLKSLLANLPSSDNAQMQKEVDQVAHAPAKDPSQMTPQELNANVWAILSFRDRC